MMTAALSRSVRVSGCGPDTFLAAPRGSIRRSFVFKSTGGDEADRSADPRDASFPGELDLALLPA
jgi:hypothetical protein